MSQIFPKFVLFEKMPRDDRRRLKPSPAFAASGCKYRHQWQPLAVRRNYGFEKKHGSAGDFGPLYLFCLRQKTGLDIHVRKTKAPIHRELAPSIPYKLIATSIDRPGIIHQICKALQSRGINIDDISTNVDNNPVTGANVFQMVCFFSLPPAVKILDLKNDLNRIGDEYNIDIRFDAVICK